MGPLLDNGSINTFPRRQILGKQSIFGYRTNKHVAITIRDKNGIFYVVRADNCVLGNCVVTHLYNNRGAVFSVLRGPCQGNIEESNSAASSCRSTEEFKEYSGFVGRR
jgi:hypothetical protein